MDWTEYGSVSEREVICYDTMSNFDLRLKANIISLIYRTEPKKKQKVRKGEN